METTILYGIIIILAGMLAVFEVKIGLFQLLIEGWWYDFKNRKHEKEKTKTRKI
jgi:hypothetical protein